MVPRMRATGAARPRGPTRLEGPPDLAQALAGFDGDRLRAAGTVAVRVVRVRLEDVEPALPARVAGDLVGCCAGVSELHDRTVVGADQVPLHPVVDDLSGIGVGHPVVGIDEVSTHVVAQTPEP